MIMNGFLATGKRLPIKGRKKAICCSFINYLVTLTLYVKANVTDITTGTKIEAYIAT